MHVQALENYLYHIKIEKGTEVIVDTLYQDETYDVTKYNIYPSYLSKEFGQEIYLKDTSHTSIYTHIGLVVNKKSIVKKVVLTEREYPYKQQHLYYDLNFIDVNPFRLIKEYDKIDGLTKELCFLFLSFSDKKNVQISLPQLRNYLENLGYNFSKIELRTALERIRKIISFNYPDCKHVFLFADEYRMVYPKDGYIKFFNYNYEYIEEVLKNYYKVEEIIIPNVDIFELTPEFSSKIIHYYECENGYAISGSINYNRIFDIKLTEIENQKKYHLFVTEFNKNTRETNILCNDEYSKIDECFWTINKNAQIQKFEFSAENERINDLNYIKIYFKDSKSFTLYPKINFYTNHIFSFNYQSIPKILLKLENMLYHQRIEKFEIKIDDFNECFEEDLYSFPIDDFIIKHLMDKINETAIAFEIIKENEKIIIYEKENCFDTIYLSPICTPEILSELRKLLV